MGGLELPLHNFYGLLLRLDASHSLVTLILDIITRITSKGDGCIIDGNGNTRGILTKV